MSEASANASSRPLARLCSSVLASIALIASPLLASPANATEPSAAEHAAGSITTAISTEPRTTGQLADDISQDGKLTINGTVTVTNGTDTNLAAGSIDVTFDQTVLTTTSASDAWLAGKTEAKPATQESAVTQEAVGTIAPGSSISVEFQTILDVPRNTPFPAQVHGIAAQYRSGDATSEGRNVLFLPGTTTRAPRALTTIVPVTAELGNSALISPDDLKTLTANDGALTQLLNAVEGTAATLAIDPRILVSIRALGTDAPASATAWLTRLEGLDNPSFPLAFADANTALQLQSGLSEPLGIDSFAFETNHHTFVPEAAASPSPTPSASATASPTPNVAPGKPTAEQLQHVTANRADIVWPYGSQTANPAALAAGGTVLIESDQLRQNSGWSPAAGTQARIGNTGALIVSSPLSKLLATALTASSDTTRTAATNQLTASLALLGADTGTTVTIALPRTPTNGQAYAKVIAALEGAGVATVTAPPAAATSATAPNVAVTGGSYDQQTTQQFTELLQQEKTGLTLVDLYEDPQATREQLRVRLLNALSNQHFATNNFTTAVTDYSNYATGAITGISVQTGSEIQLIGHASSVPVFISNTTGRTVQLTVQARATTGHLRVNSPTTVTIEPNSSTRAEIPVEAIANGTSGLDVSLWVTDQLELPRGGHVVVNVHADMETIAIAIVIGLVVVLFGLGTWRMFRRYRARSGSVTAHEPSPTAK